MISEKINNIYKKLVDDDNAMDLNEEMKYTKIIKKARKNYDLNGIKNAQLIEALKKTNGNIDEALIYLSK